MESNSDQARALLLSVAAHLVLILMVWFGFDWLLPQRDAVAAGEAVKASLQVSAAQLKQARAAMAKAEKEAEAAPPPQPIPEPRPQDSPTKPQPTPQAPVDRPDTEDQQAISRNAIEPPPVPATQEQEQRTRQEQVDLTEGIERQKEVERRQRLLAEQAEVQRQIAAAARRTRMEEQKLQQLADLQQERPRPGPTAAATPPGQRGPDEGLLARYKAAMLQTADQNWNHLGAPELTVCKVRFQQIPGGEVINVEFIACPYDAQGREFVERALRKGMMPYAGFESVFMPKAEINFCFPREECAQ